MNLGAVLHRKLRQIIIDRNKVAALAHSTNAGVRTMATFCIDNVLQQPYGLEVENTTAAVASKLAGGADLEAVLANRHQPHKLGW